MASAFFHFSFTKTGDLVLCVPLLSPLFPSCNLKKKKKKITFRQQTNVGNSRLKSESLKKAIGSWIRSLKWKYLAMPVLRFLCVVPPVALVWSCMVFMILEVILKVQRDLSTSCYVWLENQCTSYDYLNQLVFIVF